LKEKFQDFVNVVSRDVLDSEQPSPFKLTDREKVNEQNFKFKLSPIYVNNLKKYENKSIEIDKAVNFC